MFRSGGTEKAQPPFLMERLLSKLLNLNFYFMKKEKEKLFRVLPLAVGLLLVGGNAMAIPVSAPVEYSVNQQTSQVTGVVNDANGDPLIGVNVVEKGNETVSNAGTTSIIYYEIDYKVAADGTITMDLD